MSYGLNEDGTATASAGPNQSGTDRPAKEAAK
jgi:hypothetical protein